ncbi:MAG TPA: NfeD family protein [Fastidiosipila sp.]|nr:NfeD family protein [Fastidiosipila sp.]
MLPLILSQQLLGIPAWVLWLIVLVVAMASELLTVNMTTIWFALGALAALIMSMFNVDTTLQIIAFIAVSLLGIAIFILIVKPRLSRRLSSDRATNADRIVGKEGIVTVRIDPLQGTGQILVIGQHWSARTADESVIGVGEKVIVRTFQSVYAIVEKLN